MTGRSGKASAVCQKRILELPMKRMPSRGTAFWRSQFSNVLISDSKRSGPVESGFFVETELASLPNALEEISHEKHKRARKRKCLRVANNVCVVLAFIFVSFRACCG